MSVDKAHSGDAVVAITTNAAHQADAIILVTDLESVLLAANVIPIMIAGNYVKMAGSLADVALDYVLLAASLVANDQSYAKLAARLVAMAMDYAKLGATLAHGGSSYAKLAALLASQTREYVTIGCTLIGIIQPDNALNYPSNAFVRLGGFLVRAEEGN